MDMQIRYATRADGAKTAYGVMGDGPPLVVPPPWVWNLDWWRSEPNRSFAERLAGQFKLVLYDKHGCGLSDRDRTDFTIEDDLLDIEAVVSAAGLDRFAVFGFSGGGLIATLYNSRHAERVTRFVFVGVPLGPPAAGTPVPPEERALFDALTALVRAHWGMGSKALTEMFFGSELNAEEVSQLDQAQRGAATGEMAANLLSEVPVDRRPLFASVTQPALVMHRRGDQVAPFERGRELAALLPNARFVPLEGSNHIPTYGDAESVLVPLIEFLEEERRAPTARDLRAGAPSTILFTDIEHSTPLTQRLGDERAQELVREHNGIVRDALQVHAGTEIKHTGDGIMASFASPSKGIECAIAIQRAFGDRDGAERPGLRVRIGLNTGEPLVEEGDLYGTSVQLARRVCDSAEPGQIVVPEGVRHLVAGKGFLFADRGVVTLKGFEDPVRLYEVRWRE